MATDVEQSSEFINSGQDIGQFDGVGPEVLVVLQVFGADRVALEALDGAGVERGLPSLGRGDHNLSFIFENVVGVGKFGLYSAWSEIALNPEDRINTHQVPTGGLAVGREMVLRGENEENLGCHLQNCAGYSTMKMCCRS